jgi:hypothetical protein
VSQNAGRTPAQILVELEQECLKVDRAIAERRWDICEGSWQIQRRLTHELSLAVRKIEPGTPESLAVKKRIDRLVKYRDGQMRRLQAFSASISKRLQAIGSFRRYAKAQLRQHPTPSNLIDRQY